MAKLSERKRTGYKVCCTSHQIEEEEDGQLQASEKHMTCDICGSHGSEWWCYDLPRCDTIEFDRELPTCTRNCCFLIQGRRCGTAQ